VRLGPGPGAARCVPRRDLARSVNLLRGFRREASDPSPFYRFLADDTVATLARHVALRDRTVLDVGGGPGYLTDAVRAAGGRCVVVDRVVGELRLHGRTPDAAVIGDAERLPLAAASVDVVHSSNVLEHVAAPGTMLAELTRVLRPDGLGYLAYTNWLSPWGGHETSPWHYLGGGSAVTRYERRYGRPPKNRYGESLFRVDIGPILRWFADRSDLDVLEAVPRYLPSWCDWLTSVPGIREIATWNLQIVFRRTQ
jgi:SAM-dependent methyltransferase